MSDERIAELEAENAMLRKRLANHHRLHRRVQHLEGFWQSRVARANWRARLYWGLATGQHEMGALLREGRALGLREAAELMEEVRLPFYAERIRNRLGTVCDEERWVSPEYAKEPRP